MICNLDEETCPVCHGNGRAEGVTFIGEIPDCFHCKGTGCVNKQEKYRGD